MPASANTDISEIWSDWSMLDFCIICNNGQKQLLLLVWICVNCCTCFVCTVQLVLSGNCTEASICHSDHIVISVCLFSYRKSDVAWLAKLSEPKAGQF